MSELYLPDDLASPSAAVAARALTEDGYQSDIDPLVFAFVVRVHDAIAAALVSGAQMPTVAWAAELWEETVDQAQRDTASVALRDAMHDHPLATLVLLSGLAAVSSAQTLGMSPAQVRGALSGALGVSSDAINSLSGMLTKLGLTGAAYGRVVGPDGSLSWVSASEMLARTAATADFSDGMLGQLRAEGYTHKRWNTLYDSRVRDSHRAADRQTVPLDAEFTVGSTTMRYPADPMCFDMSEVANCRCLLVGVRFGRHALDHPEGTEPWNDPRPI